MNQKVVLGVLEKEGHTVTVAGNRAKFFAALDAQQFDLVLLDTRMPGLDRREATARIRDKQQQAGARIPVIALVADNMEGDHEQCLGIAVDACINKPVQAKALLDAIKAVLRVRSQREGLGPVEVGDCPLPKWESYSSVAP